MKKVILYFYAVLVINCLSANTVKAQVTIDTSAISIFWEIADTLSTDNDPSSRLWQKFANHPAYVQIEKSGKRVTYLKKYCQLFLSRLIQKN